MKKNLIIALVFVVSQVFAQTTGTAVLKFTTKTYNGAYGPDHCLAAWITDNAGVFVKSLEVKANFPNYGRFLTKWVASSNYNKTDAVTGASQTNHTAHTLTWNLKNYSSVVVPDGTYKVNLEFTEINGTGKFYTFSFNKNTASSTVTPTDQTYFKSMSLVYSPNNSINESEKSADIKLTNYPNPFNNTNTINFTAKETGFASLEIYDTKGALVKTLIHGQIAQGEQTVVWEGKNNAGSSVASGTYYYILKTGTQSVVKKAILLK